MQLRARLQLGYASDLAGTLYLFEADQHDPASNSPFASGSSFKHVNPQDNPLRPRHRFWIGPMTMIQFLADTGRFPGTAHDISMYSAKLGIAGALQDMQINHPNDLVSLDLFSRPQYSNDPANIGEYNKALITLSNNYASAIDSLWFPPNSSVSDVRPFDVNGIQTPRAYGDFCSNTATSYGFMLAYNQFSSNSVLRGLAVGGTGRIGRKDFAFSKPMVCTIVVVRLRTASPTAARTIPTIKSSLDKTSPAAAKTTTSSFKLRKRSLIIPTGRLSLRPAIRLTRRTPDTQASPSSASR